jgi:crotonobetainyl-CoA:carnitine CoA-transferase CaiB-like acyl-CoA transferase
VIDSSQKAGSMRREYGIPPFAATCSQTGLAITGQVVIPCDETKLQGANMPATKPSTPVGPMDGIRIVDLTIALSGPWAVGILADQGASVIKVETPGIGDLGRWMGVARGGISAMAQVANRGKRSIAVNLREPAGQAIVQELAARADVFVQNFRPGVAERLGVGAEALRGANPKLIYVSINGFGTSGPYRDKSAYDPVVQCYGGLAATQAGRETGDPELIRHTAADKITALTASQAISAALFARERGAGGQHVEIPMLDAVVNFVWADAAGNEVLRDSDGSQPSSFMSPLRLWKFMDGWGIAAPVSDDDIAGICRALRVEGWDAPEVRTIVARRQNPEAYVALVERMNAAAENFTTAEAMARMEAEKAPCGAVLATHELADDPHVRATGLLVDSVHPVAGRLRQPRPAARFERTPAKLGGPAPTLGQQTDEILAELGRGDEIATLRADGIVA